jgi:hypothetical protein
MYFVLIASCTCRLMSCFSCNSSHVMCSSLLNAVSSAGGSSRSSNGACSAAPHHFDAFKRVACSFCSLPGSADAPLPPLPPGTFSSCRRHLRGVGVFINSGRSTLGEASRAAVVLAGVLPPENVIISSDFADVHDDDDVYSAVAAGVRVMQMPDDDDGSHAGGYGSSAPWKKAQSRFPHALAAAIAHMPQHVKWIISQDTDTALNLPALSAMLASHDHNDRIVFGCVYEHFRDRARRAHPGGGAGMVFSRAAALSIEHAWRSNLPHSAPL